jgi:hypothetical protein
MNKLDAYRDFFQAQGFKTRTYKSQDDNSEWWVLELKYNGEIKGAFVFDYKTETLINF